MQEQFRIPSSWEGKTLKQIRDQTNGSFRPDILASKLGINENTPLNRNQTYMVDTADQGSGEVQFLKSNFETVTASQLAKEQADQIIQASQAEIDREKSFVQDQLANNPFAFDEQLAKQSATQEYQPYYSELLNDYLSGVDLKKQTVQDQQKLSQDLYKLDTQARSRSYDQAVAQAEQGFAGQGMFYSGIKQKTQGLQKVENQSQNQGAAAQYNTTQQGYDRSLTGYGLETTQKTRDIGREQTSAIESGVQQRYGEQIKPYLFNLQQAYKSQFPTSQNTAESYVPTDYLTL